MHYSVLSSLSSVLAQPALESVEVRCDMVLRPPVGDSVSILPLNKRADELD